MGCSKTPSSTNNQQVPFEYKMTGFFCAQHTHNAYQRQRVLPRCSICYVSSTRVITSAKLTNSWLTCDNKTWRKWVGQTFGVEFLGKFEHSDVIGTNPYLVLHASNTDIQNIAAWTDLMTIGCRIVNLHIAQPPLFLYPPKLGMELCQRIFQ